MYLGVKSALCSIFVCHNKFMNRLITWPRNFTFFLFSSQLKFIKIFFIFFVCHKNIPEVFLFQNRCWLWSLKCIKIVAIFFLLFVIKYLQRNIDSKLFTSIPTFSKQFFNFILTKQIKRLVCIYYLNYGIFFLFLYLNISSFVLTSVLFF